MCDEDVSSYHNKHIILTNLFYLMHILNLIILTGVLRVRHSLNASVKSFLKSHCDLPICPEKLLVGGIYSAEERRHLSS
jgi:hypothetical protein